MEKIFMGKLSIYFLKTNICAFLERAGKQEGKVIEEDEEKGMKEMLQRQEMFKVTLLILLSSSLLGDSETLIHKETE